jgi:hypothetical protein
VIKLDIINEVVNRTGITKTKAEMAVETVFESMKRALDAVNGLSCVVLASSTCAPARPASAVIRALVRKSPSLRAKPSGSSRVRSCRHSSSGLRALCQPTAPLFCHHSG